MDARRWGRSLSRGSLVLGITLLATALFSTAVVFLQMSSTATFASALGSVVALVGGLWVYDRVLE
jgi:hypothetical protein